MTDILKITGISVAVVVVALLLTGAFRGNEGIGGVYEITKQSFSQGIDVVGKSYVDEFTQGGGVQTITTTAGSYTLTATEMNDSSVFGITSTLSAAFTLTLPSTTTLAAAQVIPNAGDFREWIIDNQHLAATTTTITAGSGIDLIAVTANDDVIDGQEKARLSCWRKADASVGCIVSELLAAD